MTRISLALLPILLLAAVATTATAEPVKVSAYEIELYFKGRTADCIKTKDDSTCDTYFDEDGSVQRYTHANGKRRSGKWWVTDDDKLAVQWKGRTKPLLFSIVDTGDGSWQLIRRGKLKSVVVGVQPGNTLPEGK